MPKPIRILFFSTLEKATGTHTMDWHPTSDQTTAAQAWEAATQQYPVLASLSSSLLVAINQNFAKLHSPVAPGDEIAFMPPLQGG